MKNSIWRKLSYSYRQSNLKKKKKKRKESCMELIEFQNSGISLNSFRHGAFYWKVWLKGVKPNFGLEIVSIFYFFA